MKLNELDLLDVGNTIRLSGAIYRGNGKVFLAFLPDDRGDVFSGQGHVLFQSPKGEGQREHEVHVLDMDRDDWTAFLRQSDILEIQALQEQPDGKIAKAIIRKSQRQISQHISWEVFRRDLYTCRYCGKDDLPLTVDHLVLWEDCGPSIPENLVASCRKCNKTRGNTQYPEWLKSQFYKQVSAGLTDAVRQANIDLVETLDAIPRMPHKPSKRR